MLGTIGDDERIGQLSLQHQRGYSGDLSLTIGLEEELILLDPLSLQPADEVERALEAVHADDRFHAEFRASQLELVTPVCLTVGDARRELAAARAEIVRQLGGRFRIAGVGTHPCSEEPSAITPRERFDGIARDYEWATRRGQPCGLHVHVGLTDPAEALAVYNAARSYLPELAALAANSPFFEARDSGLASTRLKLTEDLPRSGIPPSFATWQSFAEFTAWGSRGGLFPDLGYLWWDLRPRPDYGTIEFRVADAQTRPADSGAIAAVCHALVAMLAGRFRRDEQLPVHKTYAINENRWRAIRDGLDGKLVDLDTGNERPARHRIGALLEELAPSAVDVGCSDELDQARKLLHENGALRQRRIARHEGLDRLLRKLADETERLEATPPVELAQVAVG